MTEEAYVTFETAKLLKEKGFGDCSTSYISEDVDIFPTPLVKRKEHYPAPTQQIAMRWLREVHGIFIYIIPVENGNCFSSHVLYNGIDKVLEGVAFDTYEDAVEEALKYCLENYI